MRLPILLYHWFADPGDASVSPEFAIRPEDFRRQVAWLVESGVEVVSFPRLAEALDGGPALTRPAVAITFDDAYEDFHRHALPVLAEFRVPATLFVVSGLVGRTNEWDRKFGEPERRLLGWSALRELAAAGVEIGSHSVRHPDLRRLDAAAIREECRASKDALEQGLGREVRYFAYPHGRFDRRAQVAAREAGYRAAAAVLLRPWDLLRSERFALMRAIVHADKSFANFQLRARWLAPPHRAWAA